MRLATMNWPQVKRAAPEAVVLLPLGSTEQHGPHLAVSTDAACAAGIAERADSRRVPSGRWDRKDETITCPARRPKELPDGAGT